MFHDGCETFRVRAKVSSGMEQTQIAAFSIFALVLLLAVSLVITGMVLRYKKRELQHRERLIAVEKGVVLPPAAEGSSAAPWTPRSYLLRGLVWLFTGGALTLFLIAVALMPEASEPAANRVAEAIAAKNNGATPDQVREIMSDRTAHDHGRRVLWIAGLIPAGIGLAYLITYRVERAASPQA
jgi:hypothetical protein